jgi:hypothetical protein
MGLTASKLNKFLFFKLPPHLSVEFGKDLMRRNVSLPSAPLINKILLFDVFWFRAMAAELSTGL